MTRSELLDLLEKEHIPKKYCNLDGGFPYAAWCVAKTASGWEVYYTERGDKDQVKEFSAEEDAYDYVYIELKDMMRYVE